MIHYKIGDATVPAIKTGTRVIAHICNDLGKWGAGFSGAISRKWPAAEDFYRRHGKYAKDGLKLGEVQWVFVDLDFAIVNMIAQKGVRSTRQPRPIQYDALELSLDKLAAGCRVLSTGTNPCPRDRRERQLTVHMPRIGCGLAGGSWDRVGPLVEDLCWDLDVYVYDLT